MLKNLLLSISLISCVGLCAIPFESNSVALCANAATDLGTQIAPGQAYTSLDELRFTSSQIPNFGDIYYVDIICNPLDLTTSRFQTGTTSIYDRDLEFYSVASVEEYDDSVFEYVEYLSNGGTDSYLDFIETLYNDDLTDQLYTFNTARYITTPNTLSINFMRLNEDDLFVFLNYSSDFNVPYTTLTDLGIDLFFQSYSPGINYSPSSIDFYTKNNYLKQYIGGSTINWVSSYYSLGEFYLDIVYDNYSIQNYATYNDNDYSTFDFTDTTQDDTYNFTLGFPLYRTYYNTSDINVGTNACLYYKISDWFGDLEYQYDYINIYVDRLVAGDSVLGSYDEGFNRGYNIGYSTGYNNGLSVRPDQLGFLGLFSAIADTPILMLRSFFDFNLFGINVLSVVLSLITSIIVLWLIKKII